MKFALIFMKISIYWMDDWLAMMVGLLRVFGVGGYDEVAVGLG